MKLTVRFGDHSIVASNIYHTGVHYPVDYRMVIIELTEAQTEKLKKRKIGISNDTPLYETREVIALEDKASEEKA